MRLARVQELLAGTQEKLLTEALLHCRHLKCSTSLVSIHHPMLMEITPAMKDSMEAFQTGKLRSRLRINTKCQPGMLFSFYFFYQCFSWGSPQKQYGQNGQQNMNSGPPRGGFSGGPHRGGYAPRTPQGQRPPRPHFHSEGPYGRGRGGPRGGRGFFTPRYSHFYLFSVSTCRLKSITGATLSKATWLWRHA